MRRLERRARSVIIPGVGVSMGCVVCWLVVCLFSSFCACRGGFYVKSESTFFFFAWILSRWCLLLAEFAW